MNTQNKRLKDLDPVLRAAYVYAKQKFDEKYDKLYAIVSSTYRSPKEQNELYQQGRTKEGNIVTYLDGYRKKSKHNYLPSKAFDVAFVIKGTKNLEWHPEYFKQFFNYVNEYDKEIKWGGNWRTFVDRPHFEL